MSTPCIPDKLPITDLDWSRLARKISEASAQLARYDGLLQGMVNPGVLLSPLTLNEAVLSSRIEGTNATTSEVLEFDAGAEFDSEKTDDIQEVKNYREALLAAERALQDGRPISLSMIKALHQILMNGVRGKDKRPGAFRVNQNWIGPKNRPIEEATFVPPHPSRVEDLLEEWASFIGSEGEVLTQLAMVHAQFEIIHPFMDGNGRIGRILVPIFLFEKKMLHRPMFYLSEYLEERRDDYCDALGRITAEGDWQGWLEFFLDAIRIQASTNVKKAKRILELYDELKWGFQQATKSQFASPALDAFFQSPIISSSAFMKAAGITNRSTLGKILSQLEEAHYIVMLRDASGRKPAVYALPKLLNIAEGKQVID